MAQFIQELDRIDFKNTASDMIAVGDIVPVGKMHGVAITDIAPVQSVRLRSQDVLQLMQL